MNKNKAYILGVIFGDGCFNRWKGKCLGISLLVKDKDFAEYFYKIAKEDGHNPKFYKIKCKKRKIKLNIINSTLFYKVNINNRKVAKEYFKIVNKRKNIPKEIFNSSIECKKQFIKGVIDSEGWIGKHKRKDLKRGYNYSMGFGVKDNFVYGLNKLFKEVGIKVNKVLFNKTTEIKYFHINMWSYYDSKIGFSIKRKQDRLDDFGKNFSRKVGCPKGGISNKRLDIKSKNIAKLYKKKSATELSKMFNCCNNTIYNRLKENRLKK